MLSPKRLLLIGAAPFAIAALYGGSIAFAQSDEPAPSTTPEQTTPANPTTPGSGKDSRGCPEKDGSSDSSQSNSTSVSDFRQRGPRTSSAVY